MITDFIINPSIRGLRANQFGVGNSAISVSETQSIVEIPNSDKNKKISSDGESGIKQNDYTVTISKEGQALSRGEKAPNGKELTENEQEEVDELKERDVEVRQHEQAHLAAAGRHARGGVNLDYENGPDGRQYAVGGHVDIDVSEVPEDPAATIEKAQQVKQAAMAPAEPSSQDRQVAQEAAKMEMEARAELREKQEETVSKSGMPDEENENGVNEVSHKQDTPYSGGTKKMDTPISKLFNGYSKHSGLAFDIVA